LDNTDIDGTFQMDGATFDVNASGLVTVDGAGVSIDSAGVAANFTVASDGAGEDLTIAVTGATDSSVVISSTGTGADAINIDTTAGSIDIDSADNITIDAADEIVVTTTSADGHIALVSAHTAGVALHIDADADAGSIVDVDAGILDVDVTGAASIDSGGTLSLATANNGVAVSIGHTTSETTVNDNLTVTGDLNSSNGFIGYANGQNATLTVAATGSGTDGRDLTLEAGSAPTGSANQNGGDLSLKAGGGDGTGTSIMTFSTKVNGTDAVAERMRIHTDGNVGIGTNAPGNLLHVAGANAYLLLQNTTAENGEGGAETRVLFGDHSGTGLAMIEASHSGTADDTKGKFIVSTNNGSAVTTAFTIDDTQLATFGGDVVIGGATPQLTIGDAGAEDTFLVFDGNAQDYRIGIDDGTDTLEIGLGTAHGTTPVVKIDSATNLQLMHNSAVADGQYSGTLTMYQAGEDLTAGEVVYFKSDGKVWKAVATAVATSRCVAMAMETTSADAMGPFLLKGFARFNSEFPTWTIGGALFTPEAETSSKNVPEQAAPDTDGDFVQVIGYAVSADAVYFDPDSTVIEVA
jgi:hypothetical protein